MAITDGAGAIWRINTYDEYGIPGANNGGRFQYTGQIWIPEIGMYHYKARIYSPTLGRFLQTDPIGYDDQINLYAYVANDPVNNTDPSGEACVAANGLSAYCRRAELYRRFDTKFAGSTRFFGAASMTTTYLANMSMPGAQFVVSASTRSFMAGLSGRLESLNVATAKAIESGRLGGANLDARIVHMEQTAVQGALNGFRDSNPGGYASMIKEVNGLLNADGALRAAGGAYPSDRAYQKVLDGVRKGLGRDIDFGRQSDREAIGNGLARELRNSGACTQTGSRIPTC